MNDDVVVEKLKQKLEEQKKKLFVEVWHRTLIRYYNDGRTEFVKAYSSAGSGLKKPKKKKVAKIGLTVKEQEVIL